MFQIVFAGWFLCLMSLFSAPAYSAANYQRALTIADTPPCGLSCLISVLPSSGCSVDDITCQCQSRQLARASAACLLAHCTMEDSLGTSKVQASLCNLPLDFKGDEVLRATIIVYEIAFVFVCLRIFRKYTEKLIAPDDWVVIAAMLLTAVPCGLVIAMTRIGFGKHVWQLQSGQLKDNLRLFLIASVTYVVVLGMLKVSIVMFYLQIFTTRTFRLLAFAMMAYIISSNLAIFLATVFSCTPVPRFWNRDIKGTCLDVNALAFANSGNALAQDALLLILPMAFIWKLNMSTRRKVFVGIMLAVGTLGLVATIVRLKFLMDFKISIDPTWDYVQITIWTIIELASGFASVCLPSIRQLLAAIIPAI